MLFMNEWEILASIIFTYLSFSFELTLWFNVEDELSSYVELALDLNWSSHFLYDLLANGET
jgi:hypothetical protein